MYTIHINLTPKGIYTKRSVFHSKSEKGIIFYSQILHFYVIFFKQKICEEGESRKASGKQIICTINY